MCGVLEQAGSVMPCTWRCLGTVIQLVRSSGEKAQIGKRSGDCREENGRWIEELLEEEETAR